MTRTYSSNGTTPMRDLREAVHLLWSESDAFVRRRIALTLALVVTAALLAAVAPFAYKLIIDSFVSGALLTPLLIIVGYVLAQYLLKLFAALREMTYGQGEQRLHRRLSARLFGHIMTLPLRFHLNRKVGAIGETLSQGLHGFQIAAHHLVHTFLPVAIEFIAIVALLIYFEHTLYLVILAASAIAYAITFQRGASSVAEPAGAVSTSHVNAQAALTDSLLNYETVKCFGAEATVRDRYDSVLAETESAWSRLFRRRAGNGVIVAAVFAASLGTALICAAREVVRGTMTVGDFVLINSYVLRLVQPLESVGYAVRDISQGLALVRKLLELFREKPERESPLHVAARSDMRGDVAFEHVTLAYDQDRVVLSDVTFRIPSGRTVAVVGPSGAGKSTLVRLLFRLYEPESGEVFVDGFPISSLSLAALRQEIAVVPQETILFNDTIASNIGFGRPGSKPEEIEAAARVANLHRFVMSLPDAYQTVVGERGLKLSGGERQRVAIARAVIKQPRVLVFDEATSSLDTATEREILQNLIDVSRNRTTLVIAHRLSTVIHAHEIIVLDRGSVIERGTHGSLLQLNQKYAAMWHVQQQAAPLSDSREMSAA